MSFGIVNYYPYATRSAPLLVEEGGQRSARSVQKLTCCAGIHQFKRYFLSLLKHKYQPSSC